LDISYVLVPPWTPSHFKLDIDTSLRLVGGSWDHYLARSYLLG